MTKIINEKLFVLKVGEKSFFKERLNISTSHFDPDKGLYPRVGTGHEVSTYQDSYCEFRQIHPGSYHLQ